MSINVKEQVTIMHRIRCAINGFNAPEERAIRVADGEPVFNNTGTHQDLAIELKRLVGGDENTREITFSVPDAKQACVTKIGNNYYFHAIMGRAGIGMLWRDAQKLRRENIQARWNDRRNRRSPESIFNRPITFVLKGDQSAFKYSSKFNPEMGMEQVGNEGAR